jgi:hypothetical protein
MAFVFGNQAWILRNRVCNFVCLPYRTNERLTPMRNFQDAVTIVNPSKQIQSKFFPTWPITWFQCLLACSFKLGRRIFCTLVPGCQLLYLHGGRISEDCAEKPHELLLAVPAYTECVSAASKYSV